MASIPVRDDSRVFQIQKFLGLNESNDGDTQLRLGEASEMLNWQVTPQFHIRTRPGTHTIRQFENPVRGLWTGYVAGEKHTLCAADGGVWDILPDEERRIGDIWDAPTTFFGFSEKVYIMNGHEYLVWDGDGFVDTVSGYIPLVITAAEPANGSGTTLENVNLLTGRRRIRYSADGTSTAYHLPASGRLVSVEKALVGGVPTQFTSDISQRTVTFTTAPAQGDNNVEIYYTVYSSTRPQVESMRYWEFFNGASDTRVFLYGDGSAKAIYCGVDETGRANAEYFPDLYEMTVGDANTPITAMVKHYDRLITFKPDGAYSTSYSQVALEDGMTTAGFYTVTLNREIGNECYGQVRLVYNNPRTIYAGNIYDWKMAYASVRDERNAKLISERIQKTLRNAEKEKLFAFDDDSNQEYYLFINDADGTALVHNYITDVWYKYNGLKAVCASRDGNKIYIGTNDGKLAELSHDWKTDDGTAIASLYESGNMDFGADYQRKHSSVVWVSLKPASNSRIFISARSDKKSDYAEKEVASNIAEFGSVNFNHFSFVTNRSPKMTRVKLKVKKFVYYQIVISSTQAFGETTVLGIDMRVRYTGYVK